MRSLGWMLHLSWLEVKRKNLLKHISVLNWLP